MSKTFEFIQYSDQANFPDGIYNALYNKEAAIIRIENHRPDYVQFFGMSSIYVERGIIKSSIELLIPAQIINP